VDSGQRSRVLHHGDHEDTQGTEIIEERSWPDRAEQVLNTIASVSKPEIKAALQAEAAQAKTFAQDSW
jgi:hypothetical protein